MNQTGNKMNEYLNFKRNVQIANWSKVQMLGPVYLPVRRK